MSRWLFFPQGSASERERLGYLFHRSERGSDATRMDLDHADHSKWYGV
jgi:hypothetical protein